MATFSELKVEKAEGDRWELTAPFVYDDKWIRVEVPTGFLTDFASVPRLPVAYLLTGNTAHRAAVIHDYLYATGLTPRAEADKVFRRAMKAAGVPGWRRWMMYWAVRLGGGGIWDGYRSQVHDALQRGIAGNSVKWKQEA